MAQPKYRILREYANGVMDQENKFYPFKTAYGTLAAKIGIRYYVKSAAIVVSNDASTVTKTDYVAATVNGLTYGFIAASLPAATANNGLAVAASYNVGILCDLNTAITYTLASDHGSFSIVYSEIDETTGKFV